MPGGGERGGFHRGAAAWLSDRTGPGHSLAGPAPPLAGRGPGAPDRAPGRPTTGDRDCLGQAGPPGPLTRSSLRARAPRKIKVLRCMPPPY